MVGENWYKKRWVQMDGMVVDKFFLPCLLRFEMNFVVDEKRVFCKFLQKGFVLLVIYILLGH